MAAFTASKRDSPEQGGESLGKARTPLPSSAAPGFSFIQPASMCALNFHLINRPLNLIKPRRSEEFHRKIVVSEAANGGCFSKDLIARRCFLSFRRKRSRHRSAKSVSSRIFANRSTATCLNLENSGSVLFFTGFLISLTTRKKQPSKS